VDQAERLYGKLIEPIEERLIGTVGRIVRDRDQAADVFQETLIWVWRHLERIDRHPNPPAYILRACVGRCYDALRREVRRRKRERPLSQQAQAAGGSEPQALAADRDEGRVVRQMIAHLPSKQARALLLRVVDEANYPEIAQVLGCSEATARSHVSKAKARLRRELTRRNVIALRGGAS